MPQVLSRLQSHGHSYIQDQSDSKEVDLLNAKHDNMKKIAFKETEDPNKLVLSGYLYKKSQRYHNYKKRWFVLRNVQLSYYKDDSEHKPLGVIHGVNLLSINVDDKESHHHKSKFYFKIHTNEKELQLYTNDEPNLNKWVKSVKDVIKFNNVEDDDDEDEDEQEQRLGPPSTQIFLDHNYNSSSVEQFSGVEDLNYTSNASDSNTNHLSSSLPQGILLPLINENKIDYHKVETERLKLKNKLLNNRNLQDDTILKTESENKILLDDILSSDYKHEIIVEKGQMSRLYKRYNQWKKFFIILTNKNLLFYKSTSTTMNIDEFLKTERPSKIIKVDDILDIVELDALSKSKPWCLLIITKQKRVRFSVENEEELIKWLVAITMLINRRKEN